MRFRIHTNDGRYVVVRSDGVGLTKVPERATTWPSNPEAAAVARAVFADLHKRRGVLAVAVYECRERDILTVEEAVAAAEAATELLHGASLDDIEEVSNVRYWGFDKKGTYCARRCAFPNFTSAQAELAQRICLSALYRATGRA